MHALELKVPPPAVVVVMAALMWFISRATPTLGFGLPAGNLVGIILAAAGFLIGISGVVTFQRARTTVNPTKPQSASSLVTWGIYTVTRNPMYLGGLVMLTGWAILLSNVVALLFLPAFVLYINRFQIAPEERALAALFGQGFANYQTRVGRWL